ncbi:hypothetical protein K7X08_036782 [Anisodus acutangulus]|uniref:Uncharacterized protein n=1 Tax=Anisodus acutangulus TaxID=402998 RepID=A0A9Q1QYD9_9SOLA|nr:hypothetical protein K7X08_036782 [Anisodus acutangulus]
MFLDEGLASEIGSIEDKDSVGAGAKRNSNFILAVQDLFSSTLGTEGISSELDEKFIRWPKSPVSSALCRMCIKQLHLLLSNEPHVVSSGVEANDLGAYFMRFLTKKWNIASIHCSGP